MNSYYEQNCMLDEYFTRNALFIIMMELQKEKFKIILTVPFLFRHILKRNIYFYIFCSMLQSKDSFIRKVFFDMANITYWIQKSTVLSLQSKRWASLLVWTLCSICKAKTFPQQLQNWEIFCSLCCKDPI